MDKQHIKVIPYKIQQASNNFNNLTILNYMYRI